MLWEKRKGRESRKVLGRGLPHKRILIVCEGERTEPHYFEGFKVSSSAVVKVDGAGYNTESLVRRSIELRDEAKKNRERYDEVWCVFDRDSFPVVNFNKAIALAKAEGIKTAYSNESFELWYLLHYHYYNTGVSRAHYITKLTDLMKAKYVKNSREMYKNLLPLQETAIANAKRLLESYSPHNPVNDNPVTTVHLLVLELNKHIKKKRQ